MASSIFKSSRANKTGLSLALDATLKSSHDMTVFGLGAISEFTLCKYKHFALQRYHFYTAMEQRFDVSKPGESIYKVWQPLAKELRQSPCLKQDLKVVGIHDPQTLAPSPCTAAYVTCIEQASSDGLIGHFYCRYFADLFGGSMLGKPTALALHIPSPSFYSFSNTVTENRAAFIENIYEVINDCGETMDDEGREAVVNETILAFKHNADIVKEQGMGILPAAVGGLFNVSKGYIFSSNA